MTEKKDGPGKAPADGVKRPYATLDLKATEVRDEASRAKSSGPPPSGAAAGPTSQKPGPSQAEAAEKIAAASAALKSPSPSPSAKAAEAAPAAAAASKPAPGSTPPSSQPAVKHGGGFFSHLAAGLAGGVIVFLGTHFGLDAFRPPIQPAISPEIAGRLAALEKSMRERLAGATPQETLRGLQAAEPALGQIGPAIRKVDTLAEAQGKLAADIAGVKESLAKQSSAAVPAERLAKMEERLSSIAAVAAADPQNAGRVPQIAQLTGKVADLESAQANRLTALRRDLLQEIDSRIAQNAEASEAARSGTQRLDREVASVKSETTRLAQRFDDLKTGADRLDQSVRTLQTETSSLKGALDGFRHDVDSGMKATAKPADVASAIAPVTAKISALEGSLQSVVRAEGDRKANAERIVLSLELGNLKRAMDRGAGYGAELAEVKKVAGGRLDLASLERYQNEGVPTLAELSRTFRPVANAVLDADIDDTDASVVDRLLSGARSIVRVRKTSHAAGDSSSEAIVARMEAALKDSRLSDVLSEAKKLPPRAAVPAGDWLRKVEARQAVDAALGKIDAALKSSLGAGTSATGEKGTK